MVGRRPRRVGRRPRRRRRGCQHLPVTPGLGEGPESWVLSGWGAALSQASLGAVALGDPGPRPFPSASRLPSASSRHGQTTVPASCVPPAGPGPGEPGGAHGGPQGEEGLWLHLVGQVPSLAAQRGHEEHPGGLGVLTSPPHSQQLRPAPPAKPLPVLKPKQVRGPWGGAQGRRGLHLPSFKASVVWEKSLPNVSLWRPSRPPALGRVWEALLPTVRSGSGGLPPLLGAHPWTHSHLPAGGGSPALTAGEACKTRLALPAPGRGFAHQASCGPVSAWPSPAVWRHHWLQWCLWGLESLLEPSSLCG